MKVYQSDMYPDCILLAYKPIDSIGSIKGNTGMMMVIYFYSSLTEHWERAGVGTALPYYTDEHIKKLKCLGTVGEEWHFEPTDWLDHSWLKEIKGDKK